jgi:hypothetical protein
MKIMLLILCLGLVPLEVFADTQGTSQSPEATTRADEKANDRETCAKKWERFHKSEECFAPFRNRNGSVKPEAYETCPELKAPLECSR